jgi:hypothetical protein
MSLDEYHTSETVLDDDDRVVECDENTEDEMEPGRHKYDPIARFYYPAPYPLEQGHGSGV